MAISLPPESLDPPSSAITDIVDSPSQPPPHHSFCPLWSICPTEVRSLNLPTRWSTRVILRLLMDSSISPCCWNAWWDLNIPKFPSSIQMHCTVMGCTALHCISLHCSEMEYTAIHCIVLHCTAPHFIAPSLWYWRAYVGDRGWEEVSLFLAHNLKFCLT